MVSRGTHQLKNLKFYFCDMGGSSQGLRQILKSQEFADYVEKNENLDVEIYMRRGKHPYMSSTFINGFVKDVPLLNKDFAATFSHIKQ